MCGIAIVHDLYCMKYATVSFLQAGLIPSCHDYSIYYTSILRRKICVCALFRFCQAMKDYFTNKMSFLMVKCLNPKIFPYMSNIFAKL